MKQLKRFLYLTHRWFGIALCLVFTLWFASGLVMMYVEYPELTEEERTAALPALDINAISISIAALQNEILPSDAKIEQLTITSLFNRPVYQLQLNRGQRVIVFADSGTILSNMTSEKSLLSAIQFEAESKPTYLKIVDMDQWTMTGELNPHRPLYKVTLNNEADTIVYISSRTGQVVRDTHGWERAWNWLGSTIHWIYPMQLRRHSDVWANIIIYLSLLGVVSVVTGTIVGFLRLRIKKRYKNGSVTPYTGMQKLHHISGLICVIFVATFLVSGLFSMNPWGIFDNKTSPAEQIRRYHGDGYSLTGLQSAIDNVSNEPDDSVTNIKELHWLLIRGEGVLIANTVAGRKIIGHTPVDIEAKIRNSIPELIPDQLQTIETLQRFDNYYYSTHNRYRPLPVYRAIFNDPEQTWFYINAGSGELLGRSTRTDRVERWLYNGLHSLDFRFLLHYRPAWDIVVMVLSIAGLVFCWTSIVIGWRRLQMKLKIKN